MRTTAYNKQPSPFAAKIIFKRDQLWENQWEKWTFRSDTITRIGAAPDVQYLALENFVLKEMKGRFILASIFDNRNFTYTNTEQKRNNLILQVSYGNIWRDNRSDLDLSFLKPQISDDFAERIGESFAQDPHTPLSFEDQLQNAIHSLKQTL